MPWGLRSASKAKYRAACQACLATANMVMDVLKCQVLNVGSRPYRVVGSASVASHASVHADAYKGTLPSVANDEEEYDEDDVSAFEVQEENSEYVIRLAYDAEVPHSSGVDQQSQMF